MLCCSIRISKDIVGRRLMVLMIAFLMANGINDGDVVVDAVEGGW